MAQQVKDLALPQLWHRSQLWLGFHPWPRNFHVLQRYPEKKRKEKRKEKERKEKKQYICKGTIYKSVLGIGKLPGMTLLLFLELGE